MVRPSKLLIGRASPAVGLGGVARHGDAASIRRERHHQRVKSYLVPPERPLTDGVIALRLPSVSDVVGVAEHAQALGGLQGHWLPLEADASPERHRWIVEDWSRGWAGLDSYHRPALLIATPQAARFVGTVGFGARASGSIELDYGVAPRWRGRGFATRATMLATRWLLRDRGAQAVELRIARGHSESQRVATKAGYQLVGAICDVVEATGQTYDDLRYVRDGDEKISGAQARSSCNNH